METTFNSTTDFLNSSTFDLLKTGILAYLGLLWLSLIIWVTRDSINRSKSLLFQTFCILLNILIPFLGVLLYLIIRPGKTNSETYYEELEHQLLLENKQEVSANICQKCMKSLTNDFVFCPSCGAEAQKPCSECKKYFSNLYEFCPHCGKTQNQTQVENQDQEKKMTSAKPKKVKNNPKALPL